MESRSHTKSTKIVKRMWESVLETVWQGGENLRWFPPYLRCVQGALIESPHPKDLFVFWRLKITLEIIVKCGENMCPFWQSFVSDFTKKTCMRRVFVCVQFVFDLTCFPACLTLDPLAPAQSKRSFSIWALPSTMCNFGTPFGDIWALIPAGAVAFVSQHLVLREFVPSPSWWKPMPLWVSWGFIWRHWRFMRIWCHRRFMRAARCTWRWWAEHARTRNLFWKLI